MFQKPKQPEHTNTSNKQGWHQYNAYFNPGDIEDPNYDQLVVNFNKENFQQLLSANGFTGLVRNLVILNVGMIGFECTEQSKEQIEGILQNTKWHNFQDIEQDSPDMLTGASMSS